MIVACHTFLAGTQRACTACCQGASRRCRALMTVTSSCPQRPRQASAALASHAPWKLKAMTLTATLRATTAPTERRRCAPLWTARVDLTLPIYVALHYGSAAGNAYMNASLHHTTLCLQQLHMYSVPLWICGVTSGREAGIRNLLQ